MTKTPTAEGSLRNVRRSFARRNYLGPGRRFARPISAADAAEYRQDAIERRERMAQLTAESNQRWERYLCQLTKPLSSFLLLTSCATPRTVSKDTRTLAPATGVRA